MTLKKYISKIEDLSDRRIALTGATSGIGKALFFHLLDKNAKVVILVRNSQNLKKLLEEVKEKYPNSSFDMVHYDQSSFEDIEKACDELVRNFPDLDAIVLNAGVLTKKGRTKEDYPLTIGVNYVGVRHFIDYISPKLTNHVRFVIQGSIVAGLSLKKPVDLYTVKGTFPQYNISKIYMEAYFYKLVKENKYPNIEYVLTEPGISNTGITRHFNWFTKYNGRWFLALFFSRPKVCSLTLLTGISKLSKNGDWIHPRGAFTMAGYPRIDKFPNKRKREYLFAKEKD